MTDHWRSPIGWILLAAVLLAAAGRAACDPDALVAQADTLRLHEHPYWLTLLHCRRGLAGPRSLIDDPAFFLARDGKTDPWAEMEAVLRAATGDCPDERDWAACRFPARCAWLAERLDCAPDCGLRKPCPEVEETVAALASARVVLAFPTAFMNNPASLFGHTLILLRGNGRSPLLSPAVNYAAQTRETNGLVFAFKGIFGLYPGYYSAMPYHQKVLEYSDFNQRDVWEYETNLQPAEVRRLVLHLWELRNTPSDYFFFDENCSYNLLYLFDAARPGLDLAGRARPWVIPLDTLKLAKQAGLLSGVEYRPSKATRVHHIASQLPDGLRRAAVTIADSQAAPEQALPPETAPADRARTLDLAAEYLQCRRTRDELDRQEYAKRFVKVLSARSRLGQPEASDYDIPAPAAPDRGHDSARFSLAGGCEDGRGFAELTLRPAYHDLLDPGTGYADGAEIRFLELALRSYGSGQPVEFTRLDIVRILSLSPRDRFFRPLSWRIEAGIQRDWCGDEERHRFFRLRGGAGWTVRVPVGGLAYLTSDLDGRVGGLDDGMSLGAGVLAGWLGTGEGRWRPHLYARVTRYVLGDEHDDLEAGAALRYTLDPDTAVTVHVAQRAVGDKTLGEFRLA